MTTPESSFKRRVRNAVIGLGCEYHALKNPNENFWPDAMIFVSGGFTILCEIKHPEAKRTWRWARQEATLQRFKNLGFDVAFVIDDSDLEGLLERIKSYRTKERG